MIFLIYFFRCRFSQMLKPTFEQTANILKEEFPVGICWLFSAFKHHLIASNVPDAPYLGLLNLA